MMIWEALGVLFDCWSQFRQVANSNKVTNSNSTRLLSEANF